MTLGIKNIEFSIKRINERIMLLKQIFIKYIFRNIKRNADCDVKVNAVLVSHKILTTDFLHIHEK